MDAAILSRLLLPWALGHAALTLLGRWAPEPTVVHFALAFACAGLACVCAAEGGAAVHLERRLLGALVLVGLLLAPALSRLAAADPVGAVLHGYALLVPAACLGAALGRTVRDPAHLWPLVVVAAAADVWSLVAPAGLTHAILEGKGPVALPVVLLSLPVGGEAIAPVLGVGDLLVTAFLVGAATSLGLPAHRTRLGLGVGLTACLAVLLAAESPLPALPFLGFAFAAAHGRAARPRAREMAQAVAFSAAIVALGAVGSRLL